MQDENKFLRKLLRPFPDYIIIADIIAEVAEERREIIQKEREIIQKDGTKTAIRNNQEIKRCR